MKRLTNIYPLYINGREIFVSFDHFTNGGQAVYNVEFYSEYNNFLVRYSGIKAVNQEYAARIAIKEYEREV